MTIKYIQLLVLASSGPQATFLHPHGLGAYDLAVCALHQSYRYVCLVCSFFCFWKNCGLQCQHSLFWELMNSHKPGHVHCTYAAIESLFYITAYHVQRSCICCIYLNYFKYKCYYVQSWIQWLVIGPHYRFELGKTLLYWIKVGNVRGEEVD